MAQVTITEALAETKTISARINSAQTAIQRHLVRDARMVDPLANVGGSEKFVAEQRQSIRDLQNRLVDIRTKIQDANRATSLTIADRTMSVAEWLNWRREVASNEGNFLTALSGIISNSRGGAGSFTGFRARLTSEAVDSKPIDIVSSIDERSLAVEIDKHAQIVGELDGRLSLINATTYIEL
jgi:hypothetical protein